MSLLKFIGAAIALVFGALPAWPQSIQLGPQQVLGNTTASQRPGQAANFSAFNYTAPFTGGVAQAWPLYNAQRISIVDAGGTPNASALWNSTKAAINTTALTNALATGKQVFIPYDVNGYSINSVALASGQGVVCENRATVIYSHSAAAFAISSLGPETSIENCTVQMAGGPVGATAFLFKTASANVNVVKLLNVSCSYTYACFDDEGTNNIAFLRATNVYSNQTYGLSYRIRNSNGYIQLTNVDCDWSSSGASGLVSWGCGRFTNAVGIEFNGINAATGTGTGVPALTAATAWWIDNSAAVWINGTLFADSTGGNGVLIDGVTYLLGGVQIEGSLNLGVQVTISNTAQVNVSNVFCYGANTGVTGAAASKTGCDFNAVTLGNISNVYEKNATGTGITIRGASSLSISNITMSNNTVADYANTATGRVNIDHLNGVKQDMSSAAPSSPASGAGSFWFDSTDLRYHDKNAAGTIGTTVVADAGAANNFITAISAAGVITKSQPTVGNLAGLGTGVPSALGVNIGTAGSFVANGGALGSPSSAGTLPAFTLGGTISGGGNQINNVIIGTSTPLTGNFTAISSTSETITSTSANALTVGRQGATNPVLQVDASTATVATGLKIKGAAAAGGVALSAITSGTNENMAIDAAGSGTITLGGTSTGNIGLNRPTAITVASTSPINFAKALNATVATNYAAISFNGVYDFGIGTPLNGLFGGASGDATSLYISGTTVRFYLAGVDTYGALAGNFSPTVSLTPTLGTSSLFWKGIYTQATYAGGAAPTGSTGTCTTNPGSFAGGTTAGKFTATCTAQNLILTALPAAPNGYSCDAYDQTTPANLIRQTANSTTSVTFGSVTTGVLDTIIFKCTGW